MNYDAESTRLREALERALSGDFTGHENCDGHCEVAFPDGPFGEGSPLRNYIIEHVAGPGEEVAAGFSMGMMLAQRYPDLVRRTLDAIQREADSDHVFDLTVIHDGIKEVLDEHYSVGA